MPRLLAAWIGDADLRAAARIDVDHPGPIVSALDALAFDHLLLLTDRDPKRVHKIRETHDTSIEVRIDTFLAWVRRRFHGPIHLQHEPLTSPTNYGEIYEAARRAIEETRARVPGVELTFHLSPGTSQMSAIWLILARTVFQATLIQSSIQAGVLVVDFPFELSAEFIPRLLGPHDRKLARLAASLPPEAPEFDEIIHQSEIMKGLVARARTVALRSVPVLLEGESGTGKELFARAIHEAGPRKGKPFVPVNCGAIPKELMESEFFGHKRGAFTGAVADRAGHFEKANGGTLFLDEVGELPLELQPKLLRVLEDQKVTRIGTSREIELDVRIIAATNRTLLDEAQAGRFREDLFYRLAVAVLQLPPLRKRPGDLGLLIDELLKKVNQESAGDPGFEPKTLSRGAKNRLLRHEWPGNVRELLNTLRRAAVWSAGTKIEEEDVEEALLASAARGSGGRREEMILHRPLGEGLDLPELLGTVARHYLERAMKETGRNKSQAAELLGLSNYMMVTSWMKKYKMA